MGQLKPGATYIYEKADGITYAREFGSPDRFPIGWDYEAQKKTDDQLWHNIRRAASDNIELQTALEHVKIIYYLSIKDGQE